MLGRAMELLRGNLLVRRAVSRSGKPVLVVCGILEEDAGSEPIAVDPRDEKWAVRLCVTNSLKFVSDAGLQFSPEDFLENANQEANGPHWQSKLEGEPLLATLLALPALLTYPPSAG